MRETLRHFPDRERRFTALLCYAGMPLGNDSAFAGACYHHGHRKMLCEIPGGGAIERTPDYGEKYLRCGRFCGRGKSRKTLINQGFAAYFLSRDVAKYVAKQAKTKNEVLRIHSKEPQNAPNMYLYNKKPVISDWFFWS